MKSRGIIECSFCHGSIDKDNCIHDSDLNLDICNDVKCYKRYEHFIKDRLNTNTNFQRICLDSLLYDWAHVNGVFYFKELESSGMRRYSVKEAVSLLAALYIKRKNKEK